MEVEAEDGEGDEDDEDEEDGSQEYSSLVILKSSQENRRSS